MPAARRPLPVASAYAPWSDAVLFEVSWEACHQVGGIYQVLRSKAPIMCERWGDRYLVVGPWIPRIVQVEFEPEEPRDFVADVLRRLAGEGLIVHHGRWLVSGRPRALMIVSTRSNPLASGTGVRNVTRSMRNLGSAATPPEYWKTAGMKR